MRQGSQKAGCLRRNADRCTGRAAADALADPHAGADADGGDDAAGERLFALLTPVLAPVFRLLGILPEVAPLVLIRPLSGSAALAVGTDLMREYGVDSQIGRTAAVMLGSTETTFYTISVYFGAAGVKNALCAPGSPDRRPDRLLHGRTERARVFR